MPHEASFDPQAPQQFFDVLQHFDDAMLVTRREGELRSRPMAIVERTPEGRLGFIMSSASGKFDELDAEPHVNVALQQQARFMSISGRARVTRDAARIDAVWRPEHGVWFERGRDDPHIVLIEVVPVYAEYWDRSGTEGLKFAFAMARSLVTGEPLGEDAARHGKLPFGDDTRPAGRAPRRR